VEATGRSALVTGASSGIGRAIAADLAARGYDLTAVARRPERAGIDGATYVAADVSSEEDCVAAVAAHRERVGSLDLLVNAAGLGIAHTVEGYPTKRWDLQFAVNVRGLFLVTREALPLLRASRGRIVNLASIAGLKGSPTLAAYSATKHAVVGFSRSLALELDGDGVRVTALCPGLVDTPMTDWAKDEVAAGAMVSTADCVEAVRFLTSLSPACRVPELVLDGPAYRDVL
jgi:NAD(P)-dependent dehydrogenase (short-subunit alcohol dehydrogenase family)